MLALIKSLLQMGEVAQLRCDGGRENQRISYRLTLEIEMKFSVYLSLRFLRNQLPRIEGA